MPDADYNLMRWADELGTYLPTQAGLTTVGVAVMRDKDLESRIDGMVAKATAAGSVGCVTIGLGTFDQVAQGGADGAELDLTHTISLWARATRKATDPDPYVTLGRLIAAVQGHRPAGGVCSRGWQVQDGGYVPHPTYWLYQFSAVVGMSLPLSEAAGD